MKSLFVFIILLLTLIGLSELSKHKIYKPKALRHKNAKERAEYQRKSNANIWNKIG